MSVLKPVNHNGHSNEAKEVIANLFQFTDDFRKRNLDEIIEVKFRTDEGKKFSKRKSVIARRSNICNQM